MTSGTESLVVRWKKQAPDDVTKNLTQRDQFSSEKVGLTEALVREAFQNILDAGEPGRTAPIRVRVGITKPVVREAPFMGGLLLELAPHLAACGVKVGEAQLRAPGFLVFEDFTTTGLTGAWNRHDQGGWNGFFRAFGASNKGGATGGRWGLGKLVFTSASAIRTFFALTVRHDDEPRAPLLMGQTILKTHEMGGDLYGTHGFLALPGKEGTIQLPCRDEAVIARFREEAGVTRLAEPGLSVAVVLPTQDVTRDQLLRFLLDNYFFPILDGQLEVDVDGTRVATDTFDAVLKQFGGEDLKGGRMAAFIRAVGIARKAPPMVTVPEGWHSAERLGLPELAVQKLRDVYKAGEVVLVQFPITLRDRDGAVHATHVAVAMRKAGEGEKGGAVVVRNLITVPAEADRIRASGSYVALLAQDGPLVAFLGDAEGPAHVDWNSKAERLNGAWKNAGMRLSEVRAAPRKLIELLAPALAEEDPDALIEELSIESELRKARQPTEKTKKPKDGKGKVPDDLPAAKPKWRLQKRQGGFALSSGPGLEEGDLPMRLRVRAAFDVPAGDPFKRHHPLDFDLDGGPEVNINPEGATVAAEDAKTVIVTAEAAPFRVSFEGFDPRRDLVVEARRLTK
ncbi:hypothetical protein J8J14_22465 [Roseomonas sp. SSH11]|uniref:Uncharacterized protein n=1 Tax=Pararoseomonas baculiformis TaxID=2820812 RepID=A0ABS4AKH9_9PROT|nr:hypothetical protein [Pararoseomonas baculiformis]MBP0447528.1 hypothetical protein [Pararoseomonas baculiformis]